MKNVFLLIVAPVLLVTLGFGQTPAPSNNSDQASINGCLSGSDGNYTVVEDGTLQTYKITSSAVDLKPHVSHDITVIGQRTTVASSASRDNNVAVSAVNMISDHCATATVSTSAPADTTPTATASTPAVVETTPSTTVTAPVAAATTSTATTATTPVVAETTPAATPITPVAAASTPATASEPATTATATDTTNRLPNTATSLPLLGLLGLGLLGLALLMTSLLSRRSRTS
jgi:hypothetical protein